MDDLMELLVEILAEGSTAAMGSRRVPLPVRIAIGAVLAFLTAVLLGLPCCCSWRGPAAGTPACVPRERG